jgi:metallo-beta-lactamase family protein
MSLKKAGNPLGIDLSKFSISSGLMADIRRIESFSGHADFREMIDFLSCQVKEGIEKTFLVHGEQETQKRYAEELRKSGFRNIEIPAKGQEYSIL